MKFSTLAIIAAATMSMVSAAWANPPEETDTTAKQSKPSFNFSIPGDTSSQDTNAGGGFNFSVAVDDAGEPQPGQSALGRVELPQDESTQVMKFEPEIKEPAGY